MTISEHHILCLNLLAKIGIQSRDRRDFTDLSQEDYHAVREAIESAEALGLPVSVKRFDDRKSIATEPPKTE